MNKPIKPNKETIEAMQAARNGDLSDPCSPDELIGILNSDTYTDICKKLADRRIKAGLTKDQVAKQIGILPSCVSSFERGILWNQSLITLQEYAKAVGCRLAIRINDA